MDLLRHIFSWLTEFGRITWRMIHLSHQRDLADTNYSDLGRWRRVGASLLIWLKDHKHFHKHRKNNSVLGLIHRQTNHVCFAYFIFLLWPTFPFQFCFHSIRTHTDMWYVCGLNITSNAHTRIRTHFDTNYGLLQLTKNVRTNIAIRTCANRSFHEIWLQYGIARNVWSMRV